MSMTDHLWGDVTRDVEQERDERLLTQARVASASTWTFLAEAATPQEFDDRLSLADDRLHKAVTAVVGNDPAAHADVLPRLIESFQRDFDVLVESRREEKVQASRRGRLRRTKDPVTRARRAAGVRREANNISTNIEFIEREYGSRYIGKNFPDDLIAYGTPDDIREMVDIAEEMGKTPAGLYRWLREQMNHHEAMYWLGVDVPVTASRKTAGRGYLVVSDGVVVVEDRNLAEAVRRAAELGYTEGYVTNQDGGRGDLAELIERYGKEGRRKQAGVYCKTHDVWVGDGNADTHEGCSKEQRKTDKTKESQRRQAAYYSIGVVYTPDGEKKYVKTEGGSATLVDSKQEASTFGFFDSAEQTAYSIGAREFGADNLGPTGGGGGPGTWNYYAENDYSKPVEGRKQAFYSSRHEAGHYIGDEAGSPAIGDSMADYARPRSPFEGNPNSVRARIDIIYPDGSYEEATEQTDASTPDGLEDWLCVYLYDRFGACELDDTAVVEWEDDAHFRVTLKQVKQGAKKQAGGLFDTVVLHAPDGSPHIIEDVKDVSRTMTKARQNGVGAHKIEDASTCSACKAHGVVEGALHPFGRDGAGSREAAFADQWESSGYGSYALRHGPLIAEVDADTGVVSIYEADATDVMPQPIEEYWHDGIEDGQRWAEQKMVELTGEEGHQTSLMGSRKQAENTLGRPVDRIIVHYAGDAGGRGFGRPVEVDFPLDLLSFDDVADRPDRDILREVFREANIGEFHGPYSLSVNDSVTIIRGDSVRNWRVDGSGWTLTDEKVARRKQAAPVYGGGEVPDDLVQALNNRQYGGRALVKKRKVESPRDMFDGGYYIMDGVALIDPQYGESGVIYSKGDGWTMEFYDRSYLVIKRDGSGGYTISGYHMDEESLAPYMASRKQASSEPEFIQMCRRIVENKQYEEWGEDEVVIDMQTANVVTQVYDALSRPDKAEVFESVGPLRFIDWAWEQVS